MHKFPSASRAGAEHDSSLLAGLSNMCNSPAGGIRGLFVLSQQIGNKTKPQRFWFGFLMYLVLCRHKIKKLIFLLNEFEVSVSDRAVDKPK